MHITIVGIELLDERSRRVGAIIDVYGVGFVDRKTTDINDQTILTSTIALDGDIVVNTTHGVSVFRCAIALRVVITKGNGTSHISHRGRGSIGCSVQPEHIFALCGDHRT